MASWIARFARFGYKLQKLEKKRLIGGGQSCFIGQKSLIFELKCPIEWLFWTVLTKHYGKMSNRSDFIMLYWTKSPGNQTKVSNTTALLDSIC
ncbi:hypothetical protein CEJ87_14430 [Caldifermentibacillus hisashii]|nr:hypothetical protein CEJ87_14430 [Caldifermentibacillus hisashii]